MFVLICCVRCCVTSCGQALPSPSHVFCLYSVLCRGYDSPLDISMKMDQLLQDMPGIQLTPFATALQHVFPASSRA